MAKGESVTYYLNYDATQLLKQMAKNAGCKTLGEFLQRKAYQLAGLDQFGTPLGIVQPPPAPPTVPGYPQQQFQQRR